MDNKAGFQFWNVPLEFFVRIWRQTDGIEINGNLGSERKEIGKVNTTNAPK